MEAAHLPETSDKPEQDPSKTKSNQYFLDEPSNDLSFQHHYAHLLLCLSVFLECLPSSANAEATMASDRLTSIELLCLLDK